MALDLLIKLSNIKLRQMERILRLERCFILCGSQSVLFFYHWSHFSILDFLVYFFFLSKNKIKQMTILKIIFRR